MLSILILSKFFEITRKHIVSSVKGSKLFTSAIHKHVLYVNDNKSIILSTLIKDINCTAHEYYYFCTLFSLEIKRVWIGSTFSVI